MTWRYHPDAVWEEADGVVYATAATVGEVLVLEGSAALIWHCLDGAAADEIVAELSEATGVAAAEIAPHVETYLSDLATRGLATDE